MFVKSTRSRGKGEEDPDPDPDPPPPPEDARKPAPAMTEGGREGGMGWRRPRRKAREKVSRGYYHSNLREGLARAFGVIRATAPVHLTDLFSCLLDETSSLRLPFRERMPNDATH